MRLLLIVNTSASSVTPRARVVIHRALASAHAVVLKETNRRGHAARLARGAVADGTEVVVVLGGDGTLNEAANGLAGTGTALAVLPGGSTNVFARTIGVASEAIEATNQLLQALDQGSVGRVGLGQANGRYFLFHAGVGFDAAVVDQVERLSPLKRYTGPGVFLLATLSTLSRGYGRRRPTFDVEADGTAQGASRFSICLNTDPYTYLGDRPLRLVPGTDLSSRLSLVSFSELTVSALLPVLASALGEGQRTAVARGVRSLSALDQITITAKTPVPYQLDGDYVGLASAIDLGWEAEVISLVLPGRPNGLDR
jgi:diacylglycerol kinase family enzyme